MSLKLDLMIFRAFTDKLLRVKARNIFFLARLGSYPWFKIQQILARNKIPANYFPLAVILLIGAFLRFFKINQFFQFEYDQQVPAEAAYDFFVNHKLTLIGQELSFEGFFLGPIHSWIQFIPYGICELKPDCVPYFYAFLGLVTGAAFYFLTKVIVDIKAALIASGIYLISISSVSTELGVNSNYFLFLSSCALLFCLYKFFQRKEIYLVIGALIAGLATVNFNPVYIFSAFAYFATALTNYPKNPMVYLLSIAAFLINYLPLLIFNIRHDNILFQNIKNFANESVGQVNYFEKLFFLVKSVAIPFYTNFLFSNSGVIFTIITLSVLVLGTIHAIKSNNRILRFLLVWTLVPLFGLVFYKGHIPDYYFMQSLLPFILLVSLSLRKNLYVFLIFISVFLFINLSKFIYYDSSTNYQVKKSAVKLILEDSPEPFNVYYDMPLGTNTGYSYLFKAWDREPQEDAKNLYILEFINPHQFSKDKYFKTFRQKQISVKVIGFIHVISIK